MSGYAPDGPHAQVNLMHGVPSQHRERGTGWQIAPLAVPPTFKPRRPMTARLAKKMVYDPSGCLLWTGQLNINGYGRIQSVDKKKYAAHRVAYETYIGPIPSGMVLDHICRNKTCVNPLHLEPVTFQENLRRHYAWKATQPRLCKCGSGIPRGICGLPAGDEWLRQYGGAA